MSKNDSKFQVKFMSFMFKGKEIFKPLNTGFIDDRVSCIREYVANIYFYTKDDHTIMIDAGYNYDRLAEKMQWLNINPKQIKEILVTHQDTDHTWGHIVYLIDDSYLFTGDTIWFGADGGYAFLNTLAEDRKLQCKSLQRLKEILVKRNLQLKIITGHTGWTDDFAFAFAHIDEICNSLKRKPKVHDPKAPFDGFDESEDTEENARNGYLAQCYKAI